jgi:hypothetical protein
MAAGELFFFHFTIQHSSVSVKITLSLVLIISFPSSLIDLDGFFFVSSVQNMSRSPKFFHRKFEVDLLPAKLLLSHNVPYNVFREENVHW